MSKHSLWSDEYWLLLIEQYLKEPVGVKALYSRGMVDLALELHIPPQFLYEQMFQLRRIAQADLKSAKLEQLWERYAKQPRQLKRGVQLLRQMKGFGQANDFYDGVAVQETFERDFRPLPATQEEPSLSQLMPVHLIMILDLYFRLTPSTMQADTPEVRDLSKLLLLPVDTVVEVMEVFQFCDPILRCDEFTIHPLLEACQEVWDRYGNGRPEHLAAEAAQMKAYFE